MSLPITVYAIPFFLTCIAVEYSYQRKKKKEVFHFRESVANLNVGMAERITDLLTTGTFYFLYDYLYKHYALVQIAATPLTWICLFLLTDLIWYWYHRLAHEVNLFWAAHIVHHQSEDFNFTTATRITVFQAAIRGSFWALLPVLGFPPEMIASFLLIHGAYPFFTHTQAIPKLGWIEIIFVTPTHHGVHHASNKIYLDKNYGDILIIWDKLFGTFAKETEQPVYGITIPLRSYSFLWQHFHHFLELGVAVKRTSGFFNRIRLLFGKPDQLDPRIRPYLERKFLRRHQGPLRPELKRFITFQSALTITLLFLVLLYASHLTRLQLLLSSLFLIVSMVNTGALLEKQRWIFYPELIRLILVLLILNNYYVNLYFLTGCFTVLSILILYHKPIGHSFSRFVYQDHKVID